MSKIPYKKRENSNFIFSNYDKKFGLRLDFTQIKHQNHSIPSSSKNKNNKKNISPDPNSGRIKNKYFGNNSFNLTSSSVNHSANNSVRKKKVSSNRIGISFSTSKKKRLINGNSKSFNESNISTINGKKKLNLSYSRSQTPNFQKNNNNNKLNKSLTSGTSPIISKQKKNYKIGNKSFSPFIYNNSKINKIIPSNTYFLNSSHNNNSINNNSTNHNINKGYFRPKNIFSAFKKKKIDEDKIKKYFIMNNSVNFIKKNQKNINVSPMIPKNISILYNDKETITSESLLSNHMNNLHKINQIEETKNSDHQKIQSQEI